MLDDSKSNINVKIGEIIKKIEFWPITDIGTDILRITIFKIIFLLDYFKIFFELTIKVEHTNI